MNIRSSALFRWPKALSTYGREKWLANLPTERAQFPHDLSAWEKDKEQDGGNEDACKMKLCGPFSLSLLPGREPT